MLRIGILFRTARLRLVTPTGCRPTLPDAIMNEIGFKNLEVTETRLMNEEDLLLPTVETIADRTGMGTIVESPVAHPYRRTETSSPL
jgi:hypothetical protein